VIEDPDLSLRILTHFAQPDVPYPSNLDFVDQLVPAFADVSPATLAYHVKCCMDAGLLDGDCRVETSFNHAEIVVGWMHGLTVTGGDYVRQATAPGFWQKALDRVRAVGVRPTTAVLVQVLARITAEALGPQSEPVPPTAG